MSQILYASYLTDIKIIYCLSEIKINLVFCILSGNPTGDLYKH